VGGWLFGGAHEKVRAFLDSLSEGSAKNPYVEEWNRLTPWLATDARSH